MTTTQLAPVQHQADTHVSGDRGTTLPADQRTHDAHCLLVGGNPSSGSSHAHRDAQGCSAAAGPNSPTGHALNDALITDARGGSTSGSSHRFNDAQLMVAAAGPLPPTGQWWLDAQKVGARGGHTSTGTGAKVAATPTKCPPRPGGWLRDPLLGTLADVLDDLEGVRIANANRVRILTRNEADGDGEERGHGLTADHPEVAKLILTVKAMEQLEHDATLNLQRAMRKHPLGAFVKRTVGLGEKQTARLIATIGDPYWNDLHDRPRTVSELWAYCGFHVLHPGGHTGTDTHRRDAAGVAPKRTRGQKSNWSEDARKRTWLIASAIPKFKDSPYEPVYRAARVKYADAVHPSECVRCGPKGKPAQAGSPLSLGHQNARAHRIVAKEILKDLWRESRSLYGEIA